MRLLFKQRLFSWFDSYDIYNEAEEWVFTVKGELSWGHCLRIYDAAGNEVGLVKERVLAWMPKFELYTANGLWGTLCREFSLFHPRYRLDGNSWRMQGGFF